MARSRAALILLDTNVVIAVLNGRPPAVRERRRAALEAGEEVGLSAVAVFELRHGAERSGRPVENRARIERVEGLDVESWA